MPRPDSKMSRSTRARRPRTGHYSRDWLVSDGRREEEAHLRLDTAQWVSDHHQRQRPLPTIKDWMWVARQLEGPEDAWIASLTARSPSRPPIPPATAPPVAFSIRPLPITCFSCPEVAVRKRKRVFLFGSEQRGVVCQSRLPARLLMVDFNFYRKPLLLIAGAQLSMVPSLVNLHYIDPSMP